MVSEVRKRILYRTTTYPLSHRLAAISLALPAILQSGCLFGRHFF